MAFRNYNVIYSWLYVKYSYLSGKEIVSGSFPPTPKHTLFVLGNDVINGKLLKNVKTGSSKKKTGL